VTRRWRLAAAANAQALARRAMPYAAAHAASAEQAIKMERIQVTITSTGRPAAIEITVDVSEAELAELYGSMLTSVLGFARALRSRLVIPQ
jgi:alkanesulfonate monooxygenase SsuD/methylene tetrahydromethanopterin reductase-like flavin-dependent oxidoreductase (luciferase family)